jgi:hypothetical protein
MVDLQAGPGGTGRTLHNTAGFFVLQALGDCQHLSKSEHPPSATSHTTTFMTKQYYDPQKALPQRIILVQIRL